MTDTKEDLARREAPCFIYEKEEIVAAAGFSKPRSRMSSFFTP